MLWHDRIPFIDLNYDQGYATANIGRYSSLTNLTFPETVRQVDWIVSLAKMKTHHWAGVTLSMKNLFGVMPGIYYGWPKNVLHYAGIDAAILDIVSALQPQFAIVDGIVGMEGDGPIMGTPKPAGVLVMGRNLPTGWMPPAPASWGSIPTGCATWRKPPGVWGRSMPRKLIRSANRLPRSGRILSS